MDQQGLQCFCFQSDGQRKPECEPHCNSGRAGWSRGAAAIWRLRACAPGNREHGEAALPAAPRAGGPGSEPAEPSLRSQRGGYRGRASGKQGARPRRPQPGLTSSRAAAASAAPSTASCSRSGAIPGPGRRHRLSRDGCAETPPQPASRRWRRRAAEVRRPQRPRRPARATTQGPRRPSAPARRAEEQEVLACEALGP